MTTTTTAAASIPEISTTMTDLTTSTASPVLSATTTANMQMSTNAQPIKTGRYFNEVSIKIL